jgi:hypothetical protein
MASTVRQTTLMPPTAPPMMGPKGNELSDLELESASLVADTNAGKDGASVVETIDDAVGGGVVSEDCKESLDV